MNIGYGVQSGRLANSFYISGLGDFQRVTATFQSPNIYGFYIGIFIIISIINYSNIKSFINHINVKVLIMIIGILLSFSRSSWIALLFSMVLISSKNIKPKSIIKSAIYILLICIILIIGDRILLHGQVFNNFSIYIQRTLTLQDTSLVGHIESLIESVDVLEKNLMGTGLGNNGPKALIFNKQPYLTESSYFLMLYEFGVFGGMIYFSIYISKLLIYILKNRNEIICKSQIALIIYTLVIFISLPNVQEIEPLMFIFLLVSLLDKDIYYTRQKNNNTFTISRREV